MQRRASDWRTILLIIGAGGGALLAFAMALAMLAYSLWGIVTPQSLGDANRTTLDFVVLASAFAVIGVAFVPSVYYALQRLRGRITPPADPKVLRVWQGILLVLLWLGAALLAGFLVDKPGFKWITPVLYLVAIGVPVYFFVRLATGGLRPGSEQRLWGVLAGGIEFGILPAIILELLLLLLALIGVGVYIAMHPEQLAAFQQLARQLQGSSDLQQIMNVVSPWVRSPLAFIGALLFFSVFSPLIEESAKSLGVWSVFDRLQSPGQGFALGAISGAAFGLVESLLVSATPDTSWTTTLLVRGASTMMHIMAASLTGWGIGQFRTTHNFGRLFGLYFVAMSLHGLWNAAVVLIAFGGLRTATSGSSPDAIGVVMASAGGAVLLMLFLGIPLGMALLNRYFRAAVITAPLATAPAATSPAPASEAPWALEDTPSPSTRDTAPHPPHDDEQPNQAPS